MGQAQRGTPWGPGWAPAAGSAPGGVCALGPGLGARSRLAPGGVCALEPRLGARGEDRAWGSLHTGVRDGRPRRGQHLGEFAVLGLARRDDEDAACVTVRLQVAACVHHEGPTR